MAPLIELGAGFDMDLTARENVYLNGYGAGLFTPKFLQDSKFGEIVEFSRAAQNSCRRAAEKLLLRHGGPPGLLLWRR